MKMSKLTIALPAVAILAASVPTNAEARTKSIVKWGAIGLGAAAVANYASQPRYNYNYYPSYGYSSYGYYPSHSYGYNYYPSYGYSGYGGYGGGYYGGYYGY